MLAVDAKFENNNWFVYLNGGRIATDISAIEWIKQAIDLGAGEILLTSINHDGTKKGFANELINEVESFHLYLLLQVAEPETCSILQMYLMQVQMLL